MWVCDIVIRFVILILRYTDQGVCEVELFYSRPDQTTSINDMLIAAELVRGIEAPADPSVEPGQFIWEYIKQNRRLMWIFFIYSILLQL